MLVQNLLIEQMVIGLIKLGFDVEAYKAPNRTGFSPLVCQNPSQLP